MFNCPWNFRQVGILPPWLCICHCTEAIALGSQQGTSVCPGLFFGAFSFAAHVGFFCCGLHNTLEFWMSVHALCPHHFMLAFLWDLCNLLIGGSGHSQAICVIGGSDGSAPSELRAYVNRDGLDFAAVNELAPVQKWDLQESGGAQLEYPTQWATWIYKVRVQIHC